MVHVGLALRAVGQTLDQIAEGLRFRLRPNVRGQESKAGGDVLKRLVQLNKLAGYIISAHMWCVVVG